MRQATTDRWRLIGLGLAATFIGALLSPAMAAEPEGITIAPKYEEGMRLSYRWKIDAKLSGEHPREDIDAGELETEFVFDLVAKTVRLRGGCTFDVEPKTLKSMAGQGYEKIGIDATPSGAKHFWDHEWHRRVDRTPLPQPMTVTLGPRFEYQFGTRVGHLGKFFLGLGDPRLWIALTTAPKKDMVSGKIEEQQWNLPVPGAQGKPLSVQFGRRVIGVKRYRGSSVLVLELAGRMDLAGSDLTLKNGDQVLVDRGRYVARGVAFWHIDKGVLCYADAEQSLVGQGQKKSSGSSWSMDWRAKSTLELTGAR